MLGWSEFVKWHGWRWWQDRTQEAWSGWCVECKQCQQCGSGAQEQWPQVFGKVGGDGHCSQQESRLDVEKRRCRRGTYYEEGSAHMRRRVGWQRWNGRQIGEQGKSDVGCVLRLCWRQKWVW